MSKTAKIPKSYIESHWLVFSLKGVIALLLGWFIMFTNMDSFFSLVMIVGWTLILLGAVEVFNVVNRRYRQRDWGLSLSVAIIELGVGLSVVVLADVEPWIILMIVGGYTILRGFFEVAIGMRGLTDKTDKFMWVVCGIFGAVTGFAIFTDQKNLLSETNFLRIFGTYMMVFGVTNLIFSIHSKNALSEAAAGAKKLTSAAKAAKPKKPSANKSPKTKSAKSKTSASPKKDQK
jgi:uncharacterized membrane protein HdeD (DUF308 family)